MLYRFHPKHFNGATFVRDNPMTVTIKFVGEIFIFKTFSLLSSINIRYNSFIKNYSSEQKDEESSC